MDTINGFQGGLNWDWSPIALAPDNGKSPYQRGDYRYLLNMRNGSSDEDNEGSIENIKGTKLIDNSNLPTTGTNTVIGSVRDWTNRKIYYFCHHDTNEHGIYVFDQSTSTISLVVKDANLNFNKQYRVIGAYVRDNLLYWTDNFNPPRQIDVNVIGTVTNKTEFYYSFIKYQPAQPLRISSVDQTSFNRLVKDGIFQFTYRYVFINGMRSTCAPFTSIFTNEYYNAEGSGLVQSSWDQLTIFSRGFVYNNVASNNVTLHVDPDFKKYVSEIEVLMKESGQTSWQLIKRIKTSGLDVDRLMFFNNNSRFISISNDDVERNQDYVPLLSEGLESIDNRIMLSNNVEDFPEVENFAIEGMDVYGEGNNEAWASNELSAYPSAVSSLAGRWLHNRTTFKRYGVYQIGVVFYDEAGRSSLTYTNEDARFSIDSQNDDVNYWALGFKFPSSFTPPDWATSYQIVRSNCLNMSFFIEGVVDGFQGKKEQLNGTTGLIEDIDAPWSEASKVYIKIRNWSQATNENETGTQQNPLNNVFYTFQEGHKVRFFNGSDFDLTILDFKDNSLVISKPNVDVTQFGNIKVMIYNPVKESETIIFYETGEWYPILNPKTSSRSWSKSDWTWTSNNNIEAISLPNGDLVYNKFPFLNGDVHRLLKRFYITYNASISPSNLIDANIQSMNPNPGNIHGFWERGNGRPNVGYDSPARQIRRKSQVRFSGKFITDGLINFTNQFDFSNYFIYPEEYGAIRKLVNANNQQDMDGNEVLLAIHERETISIYINRVLIQDTAGSSQLGLSERVLGSFNTLLGSFGTINPESVTVIDGRAYWWDANKGAPVRYSRDGLTPIPVFMRNYFNDISKILIPMYGSGNDPLVITSYDYYNDEFVMNFEHSSFPSSFKGYDDYKTIAWNEGKNRWCQFYSLRPEHMEYMGNFLYSFVGGQMYINNEDNAYNTYYGQKYDAKVEVIANPEMTIRKSMESIRLIALDKWSADRIRTDKKSGKNVAQESSILLSEYDEKEGDFYAKIKRDINTDVSDPRITGDQLRGKYLQVLLTLDPAVDYLTVLYYIQTRMIESKKN